ncbi:MAG TPA: hypothetical protein VGA09_17530 [Candidatus Binatia bacterium]
MFMMPDDTRKPGLPRRFWEAWKRFGKRIADIQARLLLSFFYFVLLAPFALALRRWSDPLGIKPGSAKGWYTRKSSGGTPKEQAARQF